MSASGMNKQKASENTKYNKMERRSMGGWFVLKREKGRKGERVHGEDGAE